MKTEKPETEDKSVAFRRYPVLSLPDALSAARAIHKSEKRTVLNYEAAAKAMGHTALSGPARVKIAALRSYGLMEPVGDGIQISQLAMRLLHQPDTSGDYKAALKEAALRPELFRKLTDTHLQASADTIASHLILKLQFTEDGAKAAAKSFRETIALAKLDAEGHTTETKENGTEANKQDVDAHAGDKPSPSFQPSKPATPPSMNGSTAQPGSLPIPVGDGQVAWIPFPMAKDAFDLMLETLKLWEKRIVSAQGRRFPVAATWKNKDFDKAVLIIGEMGAKDGVRYFQSQDGTGIAETELTF